MNQNVVIVKGSGGAGLGDRMCGLAVGILYAQLSGRALHVDWRDRAFGSEQQNLFPSLLKVSGVPVVDQINETLDVLPHVWQGHLDLPIDSLRAIDLKNRGVTWTGDAPKWDRQEAIRLYSIDVTQLNLPEQVVIVWSGASMNALVDVLKQQGKLEPRVTANEMLGKVISSHIQFQDDIEFQIDQFRRDTFANRPILGIHYRKTDEAAAARSIPTEHQYLQATDRALAKMGPETGIFLATDNTEVQSLYKTRYGSERVFWTDKWLPKGGESIHKNSQCPDGTRAAKDALTDIGLLAQCDRLVLTGNSSFSSLAGWFSQNPQSSRQLLFPETGSLPRRMVRALRRFTRR